MSLSATAPADVTGYTNPYRALVAVVWNNAASDFEGVTTYGTLASYESHLWSCPTTDSPTAIEMNHQLGLVPRQFGAHLICISVELDYAVGDMVAIEHTSSSNHLRPHGYANATALGLAPFSWSSELLRLWKKTTTPAVRGNFTPAKWVIRVWATL
jgi:hypothetical protein